MGQLLGIGRVGTLLATAAGSSEAVEFQDMRGWVWALLTASGVAIVILNARPNRVPAPAAAS
ncbi:hypothetical protein NQ152_15055 [Microbacterium sp. zg.B48]|uniref:hypothetical protein n=1 Tax=Microbacterium sp. zg.B48 TaxID=2969408 RepID=UPI00214C38D7|nr:hypothetical protein [Microbacterium sp. zg.B48]MCR2764828.1 hypothetical protein [Microbacterium sp. zg.B48]